VLFDLGETLINFGKVDTAAFFKDGAQRSYDFLKQSGQKVPGFRRYYWRNILALRMLYLWSYFAGRDFDSLDLLRWIGTKRGYKLSEQQWQQFAWCWYESLSRIATAEPDIRDTLQKLKDMGMVLGIVSNTFITESSLDRHLDEFGMLEFFPLRIYSHQVPWRKPNPKIFLEAARRLNIAPEHIIFVGDRLNNDVRGARNVGMTPILKTAYTNTGKKIPQNLPKIDRLAQLPKLIQNLV
jgi:HAD superfamily hydrolase (TIGR01662 family)